MPRRELRMQPVVQPSSAPNEIPAVLLRGLTEEEALRRLSSEGPNELSAARQRTIFTTIWEILREPMFLLLIAAGAIYLLLGDPHEAVALLVAVFLIVGITIYQERKTENALQALKDVSSPRALVIREGLQKRIPGRTVVRGDLLLLAEGDRVAADALVIEAVNLSLDESLLTGESLPVGKRAAQPDSAFARPGEASPSSIYSGTLIVQGHGLAVVQAIGKDTEIGRIGKSLESISPQKTRLELETKRLVRVFATLSLLLCVLVAVIYGATRGDWLHGSLAGVSLAISMVPEEFPVVLSIFLALGAWRISKVGVLTRRVSAIETLGAATVLCVDKTGTLTENRMSVDQISGRRSDVLPNAELPTEYAETIRIALLASQEKPTDAMEKAIHSAAKRYWPDFRFPTLIKEYPIAPDLLAITRIYTTDDPRVCFAAAKGAPETIFEICKIGPEEKERLTARLLRMSERGLRVLGVAEAECARDYLPVSSRGFDFRFVGFLGFADPLRESVPAAIRECHNAGVRVVMITGDHPVTAINIARQAGLDVIDGRVTGPELNMLSENELRARVSAINIFARVLPEQKLRIVNSLKSNDEVVGMTGDGVNDAPALKAADIGIAMGARGTDVAREAASLVLVNDDFASIVHAVRMGRRIFDNLKRAMAYVFAVHVPIAGLSLVPVVFNWPLILMPLHIVFLELVIDPACSTAFESEPADPGIMKRPPRDPKVALFDRRTILLGLLQGTGVLVSTLSVFFFAFSRGYGEQDARTLTFTALVLGNLALIWSNRSWNIGLLKQWTVPNRAVWIVTAGALSGLIAVVYVPMLRGLFQFAVLHPPDVLVCLAAALASIVWIELMKKISSPSLALKASRSASLIR